MPISKRSLKARNKRIKASRKTTRNRRKTQVCRVFTCKVDYGKLTEKQRNALTELFRDAKRLYNDCVLADSVFDYAIPKSVTVRMPDGSFVFCQIFVGRFGVSFSPFEVVTFSWTP